MSGLAGPADDGAWGHPGSRGSNRQPGRDRAGVQGSLPVAQSAHRHLRLVATALTGPAQPLGQTSRDRRDGRCDAGGGTPLMPQLSRRIVAEWLGTAFLLAAV